jgi:hypothetical protein
MSEDGKMIQGWAMEERARDHREALMAEARVRSVKVRRRAVVIAPTPVAVKSSQGSVTGIPSGGRAVRRLGPVGQRVGSWLIEAGTRLGGASVRTS